MAHVSPTSPTAASPTRTPYPWRVPTDLPTATPTPPFASLPLAAALPTLSVEEVTSLLWFDQTPQCTLPCWNNLTPGKSDLQSVSDFLASFGPAKYESHDGPVVSSSADYPSLYSFGFEPYRYSPNYGSRVAYISGLRSVGAFWDPASGELRGIHLIFYYSPTGVGPWSLIEELGPPSRLTLATTDPPIIRLSVLFERSGAKFDFYAVPDRPGRLCNWELELQEVFIVPLTDDPAAFDYAISWHSPRSPGYEDGQFTDITPEMTAFLADPRQCMPFGP